MELVLALSMACHKCVLTLLVVLVYFVYHAMVGINNGITLTVYQFYGFWKFGRYVFSG